MTANRALARYDRVRSYISDLCQDGFLYVHLEPTNACNTTCVMCPRDAMTRKPKLMGWETFERTMALLLPTDLPMVSLVGFGEPTLHRRLGEMIAYIREQRPDMMIKLTTNGSRLDGQYLDEIYGAGLDLLEISVVGTNPDAYREAMGGLELAPVLEALDHLNTRGYLYTLTTFVNDGYGPAELRALWSERGARNVEVKGFHTRGGYLEPEDRLSDDAMGEYQHRPDRDGSPKTEDCHKLYLFLHVNADGNFIPCVQEINNRNVLANVHEVSGYSDIKRRLAAATPVFDICNGCEMKDQDLVDYYARFFLKYFPERIDDIVERYGA